MPKLTDEMANRVADAEGGFQVPDPGTYTARLVECEIKDGPNAPYLRWTWDLVDHPAKVFDNTSLAENAMWTVKRAFHALGASPDTDTDELIGSVVALTISHREYNGKTQLDVVDIEPIEESTTPPDGHGHGGY